MQSGYDYTYYEPKLPYFTLKRLPARYIKFAPFRFGNFIIQFKLRLSAPSPFLYGSLARHPMLLVNLATTGRQGSYPLVRRSRNSRRCRQIFSRSEVSPYRVRGEVSEERRWRTSAEMPAPAKDAHCNGPNRRHGGIHCYNHSEVLWHRRRC